MFINHFFWTENDFRDCNGVYVDETGSDVRTRKREQVDGVKTFNTQKVSIKSTNEFRL